VLTDRELAALLGREGRARMVAQWNRARDGAVAAVRPDREAATAASPVC
jgi:hypothetical protein